MGDLPPEDKYKYQERLFALKAQYNNLLQLAENLYRKYKELAAAASDSSSVEENTRALQDLKQPIIDVNKFAARLAEKIDNERRILSEYLGEKMDGINEKQKETLGERVDQLSEQRIIKFQNTSVP